MIVLNKITIFEILKNQADLEIVIGQENGNGGFFFIITAGSQDNYRVLFTSEPLFKKESEVLGKIREFFEIVCDFGEYGSPNDGLIKHMMGLREKVGFDHTTYFSTSLIELILEDLKNYRVAKTRTWFPDEEIQ